MRNPLISVIVPIYNVAPYLKICVESILQQTYKCLEVILVDDGSTDGSAQICDDFAVADTRVKVIHQNNMGLVCARQNGVNLATGDYATYVDGDDWIEKSTYEQLVAVLIDTEADIITYAITEEHPDYSRILKDHVNEGIYIGDELNKLKQNLLFNGNIGKRGVLSNLIVKIVRTDILKRCQAMIPLNVTIGEDTLCTFAMFLEANSVQITWQALYHYRRHDASMMSNPLQKEMCIDMYNHLIEIANGYGNYLTYRNGILFYMYFLLLLKRPEMLFQGNMNPYMISRDDKIVIYGAGEFGKELREALLKKGYQVCGWVDKRSKLLHQQGICVREIDDLLIMKYDYVLIAVLDEDIQENIKKSLCELGISSCKIKCLRNDVEYISFLEEYMKGRRS